jgi:hypothetical protein
MQPAASKHSEKRFHETCCVAFNNEMIVKHAGISISHLLIAEINGKSIGWEISQRLLKINNTSRQLIVFIGNNFLYRLTAFHRGPPIS